MNQTDCLPLWSSNHRHQILGMLHRVESVSNVVEILGDQSDIIYSFFRDGGANGERDQARTAAIGKYDESCVRILASYCRAEMVLISFLLFRDLQPWEEDVVRLHGEPEIRAARCRLANQSEVIITM